MFTRYEHDMLPEYEYEEVTLAAGEEPEAAYNSWLGKVSATPRFCRKHHHSKRVLDSSARRFQPVYKAPWNRNRTDPIKPVGFDFHAEFYCPSCRVAYARCPLEFHETSFETFDTSTRERATTLARARQFAAQVNDRGCGFALFVGPAGPGKTRLACNIVRALKNPDALYVRQGELTCALRSSYGRKDVFLHRTERRDDANDGDAAPPAPLEIVQKVRFLVLDEIGCTALANDERLLLDELLKHRYEQRKPTILISNLPLRGTPESSGLKEFLGDALTDRIKEATGNGKFIVQFSGESYRRTTGESYLGGLAESSPPHPNLSIEQRSDALMAAMAAEEAAQSAPIPERKSMDQMPADEAAEEDGAESASDWGARESAD